MTRSVSKNVSDECAMAYCHEPPFETSRWCRKHRDYYGQDSATRPDGDEREQSPSGQQGATSAADQGDRTPSGAAPASLAANESEFRALGRDFPDLIERLRYRGMAAKANDQNITAALHGEAADAIEELCAALSEDRQLRWQLRQRLDSLEAEKRIRQTDTDSLFQEVEPDA